MSYTRLTPISAEAGFFSYSVSGGLTTLYNFTEQADGGTPTSLVKMSNGNLYGTTSTGGSAGGGTVFELTPEGVLTTGIRARNVRYLKLDQIRGDPPRVRDLPFLKRYPFQKEYEFRLLYESKTDRRDSLDIPIPLSCIDRITLSPWLHMTLSGEVKQILRGLPGCNELSVVRSTLISNDEWKHAGDAAR